MLSVSIYIAITIWIVSIYKLNNSETRFLNFIVGTFGGFILTMYFGKPILNEIVAFINLFSINAIVNLLNLKSIDVSIVNNAVTLFSNTGGVLSYYITYECSSLIEMLAFINVFAFYPIHRKEKLKKISIMIAGIFYILGANIIRLFIMSYIVVFFGINSYFIGHVIIARLIFIAFNIYLYYRVFTVPHVSVQKAGSYTQTQILD